MGMLKHFIIIVISILAYIIFGPNKDIIAYGSFKKSETPKRIRGLNLDLEGDGWERTNVYFPNIDGTKCHAYYYRPENYLFTDIPVVVMASGLGAQIDFGMEKYAEAFASKAKYAVLLFDYRGFGSSDGEIRNLVDPWKHLEDWQSAIEYLHAPPLPGILGARNVDLNKIAVWGTSMAGGHVLKLSSQLGSNTIKAVISQSPHLDGRENRKKNMKAPPEGRGLIGSLRILRTALQDIVRSALNMSPAYIPIAGESGEVALMPLPEDELELYFKKQPAENKGGGWLNMAPARIAAKVGLYSPIDCVPNISSPVLFVAAEHDSLCPSALISKAHSLCQNDCEITTLNAGHFGLYSGEAFDLAIEKMISFLTKHLGESPAPVPLSGRKWEDRERID